jgi:hypothetical protein
MKLFEMTMNEGDGVYAMSLVEAPATEEQFIALATDVQKEIKLSTLVEDKQILIGAALVPEKPIFRAGQDGNEDYYIYFSKQTVAQAAQDFVKNGMQSNFTLEHGKKVDGVNVIESWIVDDEKNDKSRSYGLDVPKGTWMLMSKVEDTNLWKDYVKGNKVFGYSLEGKFGSEVRRELSDNRLDAVVNNITKAVKAYYNN